MEEKTQIRNRAKCALCSSIIESLTSSDKVECQCKEISIWGGQQKFMSSANDYSNFIRIDDQDQEHKVKIKESHEINLSHLMKTMDLEINYLEEETHPLGVTHYDLLRHLLLIREIIRSIR